MRINQNVMAFNASRNLSTTNVQLGKSLEKLSSGFRINRAADDAAGLVISQGLRAQIGGLQQATRNAQDGISVVQTAEGALNEIHSMLGRMRQLAVQAANAGSNDTPAQTAANLEVQELIAEVTRIADSTTFGSQKLLDGEFAGVFQVGANEGDTLSVSISNVDAETLGINELNLTTAGTPGTPEIPEVPESAPGAGDGEAAVPAVDAVPSGAEQAIGLLDTAISSVSTIRGSLGATQNRFESIINNLQVTTENLVASESRIRDTDMAAEMVQFTRNQVLQQAGTAMLAQANQVPQTILQLLR